MATGDITYGTRTVLANVSRIHSTTDTQAKTFGEIQGGGEIAISIHLLIPLNSSASGGTYDLYLVESQDGTEWTDDIDPTADTGDVSAKISDAKQLKSANGDYNVTNRTDAEFHINVGMLSSAEYIGFVLVNNTGQTVPASGADGDSVTMKVS